MICKYRFTNKRKRRKRSFYEKWYYKYAVNQRTLEDLSSEIGITKKDLQKEFDKTNPFTGEVFPVENKSVVVIMDASHISNVGMLTLLRSTEKENLFWKWSKTEQNRYYEDSLNDLSSLGYKFSGFVIDGRRGVRKMLENKYPNAPVQHCQFHQIKTIKKYLPRRVTSDAGKMLRAISLRISKSYSIQFLTAFKIWEVLHSGFLKEKSYSTNPFSHKKWWYTHRKLRSAYRSLKTNIEHLFLFEKYPDLGIPNTTNICEGYFSHLQERLNRHRGLNFKRKYKMTNFLLSLLSPTNKKEEEL